MASEFIYTLIIYRVDGRDMSIFESDNLEHVKAVYKDMDKEWVESTAEKRPFRLPESELHSFLPSLITEIKVEKTSKEEYHKQSNPYYRNMKENGLSGAMNQNFNGGNY